VRPKKRVEKDAHQKKAGGVTALPRKSELKKEKRPPQGLPKFLGGDAF